MLSQQSYLRKKKNKKKKTPDDSIKTEQNGSHCRAKTERKLFLVLQYQQHQAYNISLFLDFFVSSCCLDSGSVDADNFSLLGKMLAHSIDSLPYEKHDGDNRSATFTSATLFSSITTAFLRCHPCSLCFLTCYTMTSSPGFRSDADSAETALADSAWQLLQLPVKKPWSMPGGPFVCLLAQTGVENAPFTL